ncbi:MAG: hypothetical protein KAY32_04640 [Candidatus Eisenbacteria sp.]|nr:hypothetical protein [Candidatus Eisenbacteria bacterium]
MVAIDLTRIAEEIERLERRWASLYREVPSAERAEVRWTASGRTLRWHVCLEDVVEPDIDVEILPRVLVIRARRDTHPESLLLALLPVPSDFDVEQPRLYWEFGYLEVRLSRRSGGGAQQ